jgi:hypothetical protein
LVATGSLRIDYDAALFPARATTSASGGRLSGRAHRAFGGLRRFRSWFRRGRFSRLCGLLGRRRSLRRSGGCRLSGGCGGSATVPLGRLDRLQRIGLLNAGSSSLSLDPSAFQRGKNIFALKPLRFRDLVNPFFCH